MKYCYALLSLTLISSLPVAAQNKAPIVDLQNNTPEAIARGQQATAAAQSDSYYQMQVLQEEIRQLRGMVEELKYEVDRLKQRQMDDYVDIDRRLAELVRGGASTSTAQSVDTGSAMAPAVPAASGKARVEPTAEMTNDYTAASNLLLKQRDVDGAALAFKKHVVDFPDSPYVPNSWYWLGEIDLLKGQSEQARQAFTIVVEQYPQHAKAQDATFKLGKIYHQLGDSDKARSLLNQAATAGGAVGIKAKAYLSDNF